MEEKGPFLGPRDGEGSLERTVTPPTQHTHRGMQPACGQPRGSLTPLYLSDLIQVRFPGHREEEGKWRADQSSDWNGPVGFPCRSFAISALVSPRLSPVQFF